MNPVMILIGKILATLGITPTADQQRVIDEEAGKVTLTTPPTDVKPAAGEAPLTAREIEMQAKLDRIEKLLGAQDVERKAANEALRADAEKRRKEEVETLLTKYLADGKIPADSADQKEIVRAQLLANFDGTKALMDGISPAITPNANGKQSSGKKDGKSDKVSVPRTGLAAAIKSDKIADYAAAVPVSE